MILLIGFVVFALAYVAVLVTLAARGLFSNQASNGEEPHAWILRQLCFDGRGPVHIDPAHWRVTPEIVRRIAHDRGYVETPQQHPNALTFRSSLPPGETDSHSPPDGFHWRQPFDHPPTTRDSKRERHLAERFRSGNRSWVSLRDAGLPRHAVEALAAAHALVPVASLADETDQLILFSGRDNPAVAPPGRKPAVRLRPQTRRAAVGNIAGFVLALGGAALFAATQSTIVLCASLFLFVAVPATVTVSPYVLGRAHEAYVLELEFLRSGSGSMHATLYTITRPLAAQLASMHDYTYAFSSYRSPKRAGSWTRFVRSGSMMGAP